MIGAVKILAISEDTDVCNLIHSSLESEGQKAICVSTPLEALQLLHRGLVANFFLIHAAANKAKDSLFAPALLKTSAAKNCRILSEPGDTSWNNHAEKWKVNTVLTMPLRKQDIEKLTTRLSGETAAIASPMLKTSGKVPQYHMEELDNNRFFMAASP